MRFCFGAVGAAMMAVTLSQPASAAIKCRDGFQLVQGSYISTPYCRDAYLARVAGEYGMKVAAAQIRSNPNYKRHVCRFVGRDIRIMEACAEVNPWDRGGHF